MKDIELQSKKNQIIKMLSDIKKLDVSQDHISISDSQSYDDCTDYS